MGWGQEPRVTGQSAAALGAEQASSPRVRSGLDSQPQRAVSSVRLWERRGRFDGRVTGTSSGQAVDAGSSVSFYAVRPGFGACLPTPLLRTAGVGAGLGAGPDPSPAGPLVAAEKRVARARRVRPRLPRSTCGRR